VSASLLKWFTTFFQNYYKSSLWRFVVRGTKALDALEQDKYGGLCDSKRNTHIYVRELYYCV
jgi:secreted Zn-dependent insulinase-like peptidase